MISLYRIRSILLFIGLVSLLWGCNPPADLAVEPVVVRKKIIVPADASPKPDSQDQKQDMPVSALPEVATKEVEKKIPEEKFPPLYSEKDKIDPFVPVIRAPAAAGSGEKEKPKRVPRTPLEKMDLSQLKLVAVIRAPNGNKAMVEEATGKGYIITKGTYMGLHSGQVVEILKDRLIIEEEVEDILGKMTIRKRELILQKPPGEF